MPAIEPLSATTKDYLESFPDLRCICVSSTGRVYVGDPAGASLAFWGKLHDIHSINEIAWRTGDIPGAAALLRVVVTPHSIVVKRIEARTAKIDAAIRDAVDAGVLKQFNQAYRERRLAAKVAGQSFMTYPEAQARLRKVLARSVAAGGVIPPSFITAVFDDK